MKTKVTLLALLAVLGVAVLYAGAQGETKQAAKYPVKNINVICPWGAGGGTDALLRALCNAVEKDLGVKLIVSNVTGGGGATGHAAIVTAQPDGYNMGMITFELTTLEAQGLIPFKHSDLDPMIRVNMDAAVIAVRVEAPYNTAQEFINYAKANPNSITVGNPAVGGAWNISAARLAEVAGIQVKHIPFEGTAEAVTALVGGHINAVVASVAEVQSQVKAGELKVIGVMDEKRSDVLPDAKTFKEQGINVISGTWRGLALPLKVPEAEKKTLVDGFTKAMGDPDFIKFAGNMGLGLAYLDPAAFSKDIDETAESVKVILPSLGIGQ
jgi:tripartite-type tricarboxylate transporter receptor subunit TctC